MMKDGRGLQHSHPWQLAPKLRLMMVHSWRADNIRDVASTARRPPNEMERPTPQPPPRSMVPTTVTVVVAVVVPWVLEALPRRCTAVVSAAGRDS